MVTIEDFQIKENVRLMCVKNVKKVHGTPFVRFECLKDVLETFGLFICGNICESRRS